MGSDSIIKLNIKDAIDTVIKQDKRQDKWPLIIVPSGRVGMFMKYQNVNLVAILEAKDSEKLRKALIGAIRYGKPLVLDFLDTEMFDEMVKYFNEIQKGLFNDLMSGKILKDEAFRSLVRDSDPEDYHGDK